MSIKGFALPMLWHEYCYVIGKTGEGRTCLQVSTQNDTTNNLDKKLDNYLTLWYITIEARQLTRTLTGGEYARYNGRQPIRN